MMKTMSSLNFTGQNLLMHAFFALTLLYLFPFCFLFIFSKLQFVVLHGFFIELRKIFSSDGTKFMVVLKLCDSIMEY